MSSLTEQVSALRSPNAPTAHDPVRSTLFETLIAVLEEHREPYCILAGYDTYPERIDSDVDFMVADDRLPRLPALMLEVARRSGGQLVQCLKHETSAAYFVIAKLSGGRAHYLHPDATGNYRRRGRLWLEAGPILERRTLHRGHFWVPSPADAFRYYLIKKLDKLEIQDHHADALTRRHAETGAEARSVLHHLLPAPAVDLIEDALSSGDWTHVKARLPELRNQLRERSTREPFGARVGRTLAEARRVLDRVRYPTGLTIALLGPDGSGKSTIMERISEELAKAFRRVQRQHLRPRVLGRARSQGPVTDPYGKPPRGLVGSLLKLLFFWADFVIGAATWVFPRRVGSTLIIFDRYFHDLLADPARYRYGAPLSVARALARIVPEPDLLFVLDAPAEILQSRKREVSPIESARQRQRYRKLAAAHPPAIVIDAARPLDQVVADVLSHILLFMEARTAGRLGHPELAPSD